MRSKSLRRKVWPPPWPWPFPLIFLLPLLPNTSALGTTTSIVQCPEGHFLARFSSAFDGSERFYKFGCAKFQGAWTAAVVEEQCEISELARMENGGDTYLSCGSDQYTAGVRVLEGPRADGGHPAGAEWWQLLCCQSESVRVRTGDCVETKFVNDFRRASSFSSGAQIIRRWQAMFEGGDRRWWLQICPVDVMLAPKKYKSAEGVEVRARRQVPPQWRLISRFPGASVHHYHHYTFGGQQDPRRHQWPHRQIPRSKVNAFAVTEGGGGGGSGSGIRQIGRENAVTEPGTTTATGTTSSSSTTTKMIVAEKEEEEEEEIRKEDEFVDLPKLNSRISPHLEVPMDAKQRRPQGQRLYQFNERIRTRFGGKIPGTTTTMMATTTTTTTTTMGKTARQRSSPKTSKEHEDGEDGATGALDYYDMYDDNFDKRRHEGSAGFLSGITDFVQSIQDGLTLAQVAFPKGVGTGKGFHMRIAVTPLPPPPAESDAVLFSRDAQNEEAEQEEQHIGAFVQQHGERKMGPNPRRPPIEPNPADEARTGGGGPNTIESMLQMIGLCQGHPEL